MIFLGVLWGVGNFLEWPISFMIFLQVMWDGLTQHSPCCNWCVKNFSAATCYLIDIPGRGGGGRVLEWSTPAQH